MTRLSSRRKVRYAVVTAVAATLFVSACSDRESRPERPVGPADLVLTGGRIYTVHEDHPWATTVAVEDGRIAHVGDDSSIEPYIGAGTVVVGLGGKLVLPGFIDTHAHPLLSAGLSYALLLDFSLGPDEILDAVRAYAEANPDREIVLGSGFNALQFGPMGPRKELLDQAIDDRPAMLIDDGGHSAWVNSKMVEELGIGPDTPDPIPGVHFYQRDEDGTPTGWFLESQTIYPALAELGAYDTAAAMDPSNVVYSLLSNGGVTTVFDAGTFSFEELAFEVASTLDRQGTLPFRLVGSHMITHPRQAAGAVERFRELQDRHNGNRFHVGMIKIQNDGTTQAHTAAYLEPYEDVATSGETLLEPSALRELVLEADRADVDLHIHAIGDRAARDALDAIEAARAEDPSRGTRHTIAHLELIDDADLPRFAQLDVIAQTTPAWHSDNGQAVLDTLGASRFERLYRFRELVDDGVRVTFGSDFPASGILGASPLYNMQIGGTRLQLGEDSERIPGGPGQRLSVEELVRGYTLDAAYQLRLDGEVGSLEVGKRADFIVLSQNMFEIPADELSSVSVEARLLDGELVSGSLQSSQ